jgi:hypothetical protein
MFDRAYQRTIGIGNRGKEMCVALLSADKNQFLSSSRSKVLFCRGVS